jgi:hypothetical protein
VDAARFAVVGGLAVAVLGGQASIALLAVVGFLLGTGQTLVDTGTHSILPALVSRDPERLQRANGRLVGTQVVTQELAGPPAGGFLFSLSAWVPFAVDAVSFAAGSALVASIRGHFGPAADDLGHRTRRTTLATEIAEGLRWLAAHRVLRATAAMVSIVNLLAAGGAAVMVLFAHRSWAWTRSASACCSAGRRSAASLPVLRPPAVVRGRRRGDPRRRHPLPARRERPDIAAARAAAGLEPGP